MKPSRFDRRVEIRRTDSLPDWLSVFCIDLHDVVLRTAKEQRPYGPAVHDPPRLAS
jgi:hypothetical protein